MSPCHHTLNVPVPLSPIHKAGAGQNGYLTSLRISQFFVGNFLAYSKSFRKFAADMLNRQECIDKIKANSEYITSQFEVSSLRLFGSLARNEQRESSDVDVCVEMPPDLFQLIGLKQYLEELLCCNVDVIRVHSNIDPFLMNQIEKDGIYIIRESSRRMAYA